MTYVPYKLTLTKHQAQCLVWDSLADDETDTTVTIEDTRILDTDRWTVMHEVVFKHSPSNTFWLTTYRVGATEYQDEQPWEYDEPELTRVYPHEVMTRVWKTDVPFCGIDEGK